jgi:hypothetical protein
MTDAEKKAKKKARKAAQKVQDDKKFMIPCLNNSLSDLLPVVMDKLLHLYPTTRNSNQHNPKMTILMA